MANPFVHVELSTGDLKAAKKFYRRVFDWKLQDMKMGPGMVYTMIDVGKGVGGGMQQNPQAGEPSSWMSYVEVESLAKTVAKAKRAGANVLEERIEVPGMGALAIFVDPTGAVLGLWEPAKKAPARKAPAKKTTAKKK